MDLAEAANASERTTNLLLVSFSFPPAGGVGVLRALSFARYLPASGVRVDVLTARNAPSVGKDLGLLAQVPAAVTVHRTWTLDLPFALRKGIKKLMTGSKAAASAAGPAVASPAATRAGGGNPVKRLLADLLLPDPQVGWLPFAIPAAKAIVRERRIDCVLITVPPFSSVQIAPALRRSFPGLTIIVDFRDEWLTTTINLVSFSKSERARVVAEQTEGSAVRAATAVVAVTEAARQELIGRYPHEDPAKFFCVPNGFEPRVSDPRDTMAATRGVGDDVVVLTYLGSVYGSTDPGTFVEAILALPAELRARLKVRFIGHVETDAYRQMLARLGETVELRGFLPQAEALRAIDDTDYLLLITHDRINVSAKFYDYLSGTKPILAAVQPAGDVRRLLEETGAGVWADINDVAAIGRLLVAILSGSEGELTVKRNADKIAGYHRQALAERYATLIKDLTSAKYLTSANR